ncbi:hypothetical protein [Halocalculus aciditolerans]|uniref:Uncharacterized protein n=1 Tax=Halocalculus aciditolerans TaxID=1383812 RepID=A0A830F920_9EURY|nr:hypothetical protein [Halocalculus aciditolerans]GGL51086.1 hypothetical protein GCM10009039_06700 [Halocalculus aciditolerans]
MLDDSERRAVAVDFITAGSAVVVAALQLRSFHPPFAPWVAGVAAVATAGLLAAADRSRAGVYALVAVGVAAILGIVWAVAAADDVFRSVPWLLLGIGVGALANRLAFGVIRPLPDFRRERV